MTDDLLISMGAIFLISYVALQISFRRIIGRLKQIDTTLWVAMGSPAATYFTKFRNYTTSRPQGFDTPPTEYSDLSMWMTQRCYEQLRDAEITKYAALYRLAGYVQTVAVLLALGVVLYARFH